MANDLQFYYSLSDIPDTIKDGNIYFILNDSKDITHIKLDIEGQRYSLESLYSEATENSVGLMSANDKKKLNLFTITHDSDSNIQNIDAEANFNFLKNILINGDQVLTTSTLQDVEVHAVGQDEPEQPNSIQIIPTENDKFILKMILNLPQGPQGERGLRGKASIINNVTATIDDNIGESAVEVEAVTVENEDDFSTDLVFNFSNLKGEQGEQGEIGPEGPQGIQGPQGSAIGLDFNFLSGTTLEQEHHQEEGEDGIIREVYTITIPRGEKGNPGKSFTISQTFKSVEEMEAAKTATAEQENYIPLDSFILITNTETDPATGEIYYRGLDGEITFVVDMAPTQPIFSADAITVDSDQSAEAVVDNGENNVNIATPTIHFKLPRGKQLKVGDLTTTINKNFGTPSVEGVISESGTVDNKQMNLNLNFKNMGTITPIGIGNVNADNLVLENPTVTISSREDSDNVTQLLDFNFSGFKGQKGDAADSFDTSTTGITAEYLTDSTNPAPRARVEVITENGRIQLAFKFYNLKGEEGELKGINITGSGNAITSINRDTTHQNFLIATKGETFATETYAANGDNISTGTVKATRGGTGLNNINENAILLGKGNNATDMKVLPSTAGALYSMGNNQSPQYGILPVTLGGTGNASLIKNSILLGNGTDNVNVVQSSSGALYAIGNGYTPQFGTLPVPQGGTGQITIQANSVILGNDGLALKNIQSTKGAFFSEGTNEEPKFGVLPVSIGGTGAETAEQARINLGAAHASIKQQEDSATDFLLQIDNVMSYID